MFYLAHSSLLAHGALDWYWGVAEGYLISDLLLRSEWVMWSIFHGGAPCVGLCWLNGWCGRAHFVPLAGRVLVFDVYLQHLSGLEYAPVRHIMVDGGWPLFCVSRRWSVRWWHLLGLVVHLDKNAILCQSKEREDRRSRSGWKIGEDRMSFMKEWAGARLRLPVPFTSHRCFCYTWHHLSLLLPC